MQYAGFFPPELSFWLTFLFFLLAALWPFFPNISPKKKVSAKGNATNMSPHTNACRYVRQTLFFLGLMFRWWHNHSCLVVQCISCIHKVMGSNLRGFRPIRTMWRYASPFMARLFPSSRSLGGLYVTRHALWSGGCRFKPIRASVMHPVHGKTISLFKEFGACIVTRHALWSGGCRFEPHPG